MMCFLFTKLSSALASTARSTALGHRGAKAIVSIALRTSVAALLAAASITLAAQTPTAEPAVLPLGAQEIASSESLEEDPLQDQALAPSQQSLPMIHHSLVVEVDPQSQSIAVEDTITVPLELVGSLTSFALNSNLTMTSAGMQPQVTGRSGPAIGINSNGSDIAQTNQYELPLAAQGAQNFTLSYNGRIYNALRQVGAQYSQGFSETVGIISDAGVYLSKGSVWIPEFDTDLISFDMEVRFAANASSWTAVSQGESQGRNRWRSDQPMEEVYLVAADFTEYSVESNGRALQVFLRNPDQNLATKYLDATERYLALYEPLLGEYPFSKFALIENFWETGYGMPSFTLLGEQIIRFPFILESSYPHEILHNWWGNGVYPDYQSGNWSEGLTAYLADHLFREMEGTGFEYRKEMLARYKNYVADETDFPLSDFTSRNSAATQAVGYGKTLMLWHMLRLELGDELFLQGLRKFYQDYQFRRASFAEIEALFSAMAGRDLSSFFSQWIDRTGAPGLALSVDDVDGQARILFTQLQTDEPYELTVPVALYYAGEVEAQVHRIPITQKLEGVMATNYDQLQAVVVDPYFDIFRTLDREETPPTVGELFGASTISFIVPRQHREEWLRLASAFAAGVQAEFLNEEELDELPSERSVWVLGKDNKFASSVAESVSSYGANIEPSGIALNGSQVEFNNRSSVLVGRHPQNSDLALGWITIDDMVALAGMIEKLPHYGKYSYLSFTGAEPTNDISGVWVSANSPLQWVNPRLAVGTELARLPELTPLATLPAKYLPEQLAVHVDALTTPAMQGRGLGTLGLDLAAQYIAAEFAAAGLESVAGSYLQQWSQPILGQSAGSQQLTNVVGMIPGSNPEFADKPVVIAAHYDHLGMDETSGAIFSGADDNASGVSIMLEVAAKLSRAFSPQRSIVFVAFTGEEQGLLGSQYFVQNPPGAIKSEDIFAMINLDSVGRLEGRKLQVFATDSAYEWPFMAQGIGFTIGVESEFPAQTIASSDHVSFLEAGIPAIHLFSGVHNDYHRESDSADKLDLSGMSDIALWLEEATVYMADRTDPLRVNLSNAPIQTNTSPAAGSQRQVSVGTVPDFTYQGPGIRISGVTPSGAAEAAGLQEGDVLLRFNDQEITDLQQYSNLIRQSAVGDVITLEVERAGSLYSATLTLQAR